MSSSGSGKARVGNWTHRQDVILIDLLLENFVKTGVKPGTQKSIVFTNILRQFNDAAGVHFTKDNLINRWRNLRKDYVLYTDLCNRSGWSWDDSTKLPVPSGVSGWDEVIALKPEYRRIRDKPYLFMQKMTDLCGSTTATGFYSFGSSQALPLRRPVQLSRDDFCSDSHQPFPTTPQDSGGIRHDESQVSMSSRWSTSRLSDASHYQDKVPLQETQFTNLLVRGTGTTWQDLTEDEPTPHTVGVYQQPPDHSLPHPGWRILPRRGSIIEDDAVSSHRPTSSRRLSTGQRQRRSKQPPPSPQPQPPSQAFHPDVIKWMNMCRDRYQREIASVDDEEADICACVEMLKSLPGFPQENFYSAITLFSVASNRRMFKGIPGDQYKVGWILHMLSS